MRTYFGLRVEPSGTASPVPLQRSINAVGGVDVRAYTAMRRAAYAFSWPGDLRTGWCCVRLVVGGSAAGPAVHCAIGGPPFALCCGLACLEGAYSQRGGPAPNIWEAIETNTEAIRFPIRLRRQLALALGLGRITRAWAER